MPQVQLTLLFTTLVVAFCSMTYELILAQTLATLLGDTLTQYAITIAVFLSAMGMGAFLFEREKSPSLAGLIRIELLLSVFGAVCPFVLILIHHAFQNVSDSLRPWIIPAMSHTFTLIIGYLSGRELPFLMHLADADRPGAGADHQVLATDYGGMLLATLAFPFVLLPGPGLFLTSILTGLLNIAMAWLLLSLLPRTERSFRWKPLAGASALLGITLYYGITQERHFIQKYFMGL